jgi:hypothetical protein
VAELAKGLRALLALLIILTLVLTVVGCGKKDEAASTSGDAPPTPAMGGAPGGAAPMQVGAIPAGVAPGGAPMSGMGNASAGAPGGAMPTGAAPAAEAAPAPAAIEYEKVPFAKAPRNSGVKRVVKASELGPDIVMYQFTWKESTGGVVWYVELPEHYTKTDRTAAAWQQLYRALGESSEARKLKQELDF